MTGTFDGTTFTVTDAVPGALYDPADRGADVPRPGGRPHRRRADRHRRGARRDRSRRAQGAYAADGHVLVDVIYDDGSLQAWADEEYGENVVVVTSALVDTR